MPPRYEPRPPSGERPPTEAAGPGRASTPVGSKADSRYRAAVSRSCQLCADPSHIPAVSGEPSGTACPATVTRDGPPPSDSARRPRVMRALDRWPRACAASAFSATTRTHRSLTVTPNACVALSPPESRAVTVTNASPRPTAVTVSVEPDTDTVADASFADAASYLSASPAAKYADSSSVTGPAPSSRAWAGMTPTAAGASATSSTVTATAAAAVNPSGPRASTRNS